MYNLTELSHVTFLLKSLFWPPVVAQNQIQNSCLCFTDIQVLWATLSTYSGSDLHTCTLTQSLNLCQTGMSFSAKDLTASVSELLNCRMTVESETTHVSIFSYSDWLPQAALRIIELFTSVYINAHIKFHDVC